VPAAGGRYEVLPAAIAERVQCADHAILLPGTDDRGSRIVCPVRVGDRVAALLWSVEAAQPFSVGDSEALEQAAMVAALHLAQQRRFVELEQRLRGNFVELLLEGRFDDSSCDPERASLMGFDLDGAYRVGLLLVQNGTGPQSTSPGNVQVHTSRVRRMLAKVGAPNAVYAKGRQIAFLLPEDADPALVWHETGAPDVSLCLSSSGHRPSEVQKGYQEVLELLPFVRPERMFTPDDLLVPRVLLGDRGAQEAFLEQLFGKLRRTRGGDVLFETLVSFALHGFQRDRTARALFVHPNTLRYRLDRVAKVTDLNLRDPEARFRIELGSRLIFLRGEGLTARAVCLMPPQELCGCGAAGVTTTAA
jgi:PucR family transcriptional regulator, purine catabolism regulatory protein